MPCAQLILLGRLPLTDKIAQCVGIFIRKLQPDFLFGLWMQGLALCTLSRYEEAIETLEKVLVISRAPMFMGLLGAAYARAGRADDAIRLLNELEDRSSQANLFPPVLSFPPMWAWARLARSVRRSLRRLRNLPLHFPLF